MLWEITPPENGYVWKNALTYTGLQYDFHKFTQESAQFFDKIDSNLSMNINESLYSERLRTKTRPGAKMVMNAVLFILI